jgi:hypothetical protein
MYIYDNTNLLTKRRRKTRAKILDQIKILSLIHNDEKIEEIQNEGIKPPNSTLEKLKKINDERIKKLEKEDSERRENEIVNIQKIISH